MNTREMNTHLSHEEIQEYIGGALEMMAQTRVAGHLRVCKMCNSTYHAFVEIDQALRSSPPSRLMQPPEKS
jgi:anti-sigma factor RsiW